MNFKPDLQTFVLVAIDVIATYLALVLATVVTLTASELLATTDWLFTFGIMAASNVASFIVFRLYSNMWQYASGKDIGMLVAATLCATFAGALVQFIASGRLPIRVYGLAWLMFLVVAGGARYALYSLYRRRHASEWRPPRPLRPRTLVVGAGEVASYTIERMNKGDTAMQGLPIIAVDDDKNKIKKRIRGVKVAGPTEDIPKLAARHQIVQIVVAMPSATTEQRKRIYDICIQTNCHLLTLPDVPNVSKMHVKELDKYQLRDVDLKDLLSREEVVLNTCMVSGYLADKTVLITGGGGSIGSELARQACTVAPQRLIIFDIYENTAFELANELNALYSDIDILVEIGSVRDPERLEALFATYRPDVVFHAAAHKHVPLMETNPREAVLNNVFGTLNMARCADAHDTKTFIFISTDKAVNPSSVMGATKRLGEMIVQSYASRSSTCFSAVRFGNVLGSHGSVIPSFQRQIDKGGPVTVTHAEITRYFMTIPESARLVVTAGGMAKGGEIFILEMGEPVKIVDLARDLIRLNGLVPDKDIQIEYTGLRKGEKLHEELLMQGELQSGTVVSGIMVSTGTTVTESEVTDKLNKLEKCLKDPSRSVRECLVEVVPTYSPDLVE
ncbi:MAG: polysaccharide biosynthesis protein [Coriobacteriales bacterium]|jgi:FlaA1/EpsC-like NDP-sugar epimerase|nr:polysaccharide biosynthesis protein [Coriobacteriales bacterium]